MIGNDSTITISKSMLEKLEDTLRYGVECAEARRHYEHQESLQWKSIAVPFEDETEKPMTYWEFNEKVRREVGDQRLKFFHSWVIDKLASEVTF